MSNKRPAEEQDPDNLLTFIPCGAGQEVGRSCHVLKFKGKTIMLDCGSHPGFEGAEGLPYFDEINAEDIDLILITHFHIDHCGALPYFVEKTTFRGKIFMTYPTKGVMRWILQDSLRMGNISDDKQLFNERDVKNTMDKVETIDFHESKEVGGVKFTAYHAGHVLGGAMFMIEIAGVKVLYTGDYSREEDRHLKAAEVPEAKPDIMICESTYGTQLHPSKDEREHRFTQHVHDIVMGGGRCLVPVFALGRAQELLLILDEYWSQHPELDGIPIHYASSLARKCMEVYEQSTNNMNDSIARIMREGRNPFKFEHIQYLKSLRQFDDHGPSVVLASPGMLQSGMSRQLFDSWCRDAKNGVIITGYSVANTLAKTIADQPASVKLASGDTATLRMGVFSISFSAHVDYQQNSEFIRLLEPPKVILVHGAENEMQRFKDAFEREYGPDGEKHDPDYEFTMYNPANTEELEFYFRGDKMAKVIGRAADEQSDGRVNGLLIKRSLNNYIILDPSELEDHSNLKLSTVQQKQVVTFPYSFEVLRHFLLLMHGEDAVAERRVDGTQVLVVMEKVEVSLDEPQSRAILTWKAGPESDMWADSVLSVVLQVEGSPEVVTFTHSKKCNHAKNDEERGPKVEEVPEAEPAAVTVDDPLEEILADARPSAPLDPADDSDATPIRDASSPEPPFSRTLRLLLERMFGECSRDTSGVLHVRNNTAVADIVLQPIGDTNDGLFDIAVESDDPDLRSRVAKAAGNLRLTQKMTPPPVMTGGKRSDADADLGLDDPPSRRGSTIGRLSPPSRRPSELRTVSESSIESVPQSTTVA